MQDEPVGSADGQTVERVPEGFRAFVRLLSDAQAYPLRPPGVFILIAGGLFFAVTSLFTRYTSLSNA